MIPVDITNDYGYAPLIPAQTITADTDGDAVNTTAYEGTMAVIVNAGAAEAGGTLALAIEHRTDASDTWAAIPAEALIDPGTGEPTTLPTIDDTGAVHAVAALVKEYLKAQVRVTVDQTTAGGALCVLLAARKKYADGRV
jgi:hypothetical protein